MRFSRNFLAFLAGWLFISLVAVSSDAFAATEWWQANNVANNPGYVYTSRSAAQSANNAQFLGDFPGGTVPGYTLKQSGPDGNAFLTWYQYEARPARCPVYPGSSDLVDCGALTVEGLVCFAGYEFPGNGSKNYCVPDPDPDPVDACKAGDSVGLTGLVGGDGAYAGQSLCSGDCEIEDSANNGYGCEEQTIGGVKRYVCGVANSNWVETGADCSTGVPAVAAGESCKAVNGETVCTGGSTPKNCVKINGELSCVSSAGDVCRNNECTSTGGTVERQDGSAVARSTTPTPTAPNTGTPGQRATPSSQWSQSSFNRPSTTPTGSGTYDHWNSATVGTSNKDDGSVGRATSGTDDGGDDGTDEGEGDCVSNPDGPDCGGNGEFSGPGTGYDFGSVEAELQAAREARSTEFATVRAEAAAMFSAIPSSSGRLPSWSFSIRGEPVSIDLNVYADKLAFLGTVLVFISLVAAAMIIFGGRE